MNEDENRALIDNDADNASATSEHHHHHHRHHSKAYYKYKKRKHKLKKFFRKNKWIVLFITLLVATIAVLVTVISVTNNKNKKADDVNPADVQSVSAESGEYVNIYLPYFSQSVPVVDDIVIRYINDSELTPLYSIITDNDRKRDLDGEKRVTLALNISNIPNNAKILSSYIEVSENPDFTNPIRDKISSLKGGVVLKFLKTDTKYYYRIIIKFDNDSEISSNGTFTTAASPRLITLDGVDNVRDIGGWKTVDGKTVKQGMLYRGSELDGVFFNKSVITDEGISDAHKYLGIVSEFDLRGLSDGNIPEVSALGVNVNHKVYDAYDYEYALQPAADSYIKELFSDLADESNYPVYMHCIYGLDRSGTACFLLEALLGLSDYDLIREFELSTLTYTSDNLRSKDSDFSEFLTAFYNLSGATAKEKAENYLLSCGVTQEQIESIRNIFLED